MTDWRTALRDVNAREDEEQLSADEAESIRRAVLADRIDGRAGTEGLALDASDDGGGDGDRGDRCRCGCGPSVRRLGAAAEPGCSRRRHERGRSDRSSCRAQSSTSIPDTWRDSNHLGVQLRARSESDLAMTNLLRVTCVTLMIGGTCPLIAAAQQATEALTPARGGQRGGRGTSGSEGQHARASGLQRGAGAWRVAGHRRGRQRATRRSEGVDGYEGLSSVQGLSIARYAVDAVLRSLRDHHPASRARGPGLRSRARAESYGDERKVVRQVFAEEPSSAARRDRR